MSTFVLAAAVYGIAQAEPDLAKTQQLAIDKASTQSVALKQCLPKEVVREQLETLLNKFTSALDSGCPFAEGLETVTWQGIGEDEEESLLKQGITLTTSNGEAIHWLPPASWNNPSIEQSRDKIGSDSQVLSGALAALGPSMLSPPANGGRPIPSPPAAPIPANNGRPIPPPPGSINNRLGSTPAKDINTPMAPIPRCCSFAYSDLDGPGFDQFNKNNAFAFGWHEMGCDHIFYCNLVSSNNIVSTDWQYKRCQRLDENGKLQAVNGGDLKDAYKNFGCVEKPTVVIHHSNASLGFLDVKNWIRAMPKGKPATGELCQLGCETFGNTASRCAQAEGIVNWIKDNKDCDGNMISIVGQTTLNWVMVAPPWNQCRYTRLTGPMENRNNPNRRKLVITENGFWVCKRVAEPFRTTKDGDIAYRWTLDASYCNGKNGDTTKQQPDDSVCDDLYKPRKMAVR